MATTREFYLARAAEARAEAKASNLENVRERHLRAATAWEEMADRVARTDRMREETEARKAAEAAQQESVLATTG